MKYDIGDKVRFVNKEAHEESPEYYPECGTVGRIDDIDEYDYFLVSWPAETVKENARYGGDYSWWVEDSYVELVEE